MVMLESSTIKAIRDIADAYLVKEAQRIASAEDDAASAGVRDAGREALAAQLTASLESKSESRFNAIAFVHRHEILAALTARPDDGEGDGQDRKFAFRDGQFVNRVSGEAIPTNEPIIIFRARDNHALPVLWHYLGLASHPKHRLAIIDRINEFAHYRGEHPDRMKEPGVTGDIVLNDGHDPRTPNPTPATGGADREQRRLAIAQIIDPSAFRGGFLSAEFERLGVGVSPKVSAFHRADAILTFLTNSDGRDREAVARIICEIVVRITCSDYATEALIQAQVDRSWQHWTDTADAILALLANPDGAGR